MGDPAALAALQARALAVPRPWSAAEITAFLASPGAILIAPDVLGFALGRVAGGPPGQHEAELITLVVAPEARRCGRGRALLAAFEGQAARMGACEAFLEVASDNRPALALYRAAGWQERGVRRGYYRTAQGERHDARVLGKDLRRSGRTQESC
jgi:ribosomal-protein-alanine N-acetyltransferase